MDSVAERAAAGDDRAIRFTGNWREYLPIAATNALLIVCTLGVYRFWATARQRRYLWSRTQVIDDTLEWTGTGKEMFIGFLIVVGVVLLPLYAFIQFLFPWLFLHGKQEAAFGILFLFEIALIYLGGFALFRALRYRLSRTFWHGIRGGSNDPGWNYGGEYLGRYALTFMTMFIMFPWATTRLWNSRWNAMSFGPLKFYAHLNAEGLKWRWALLYLAPIGLMLIVFMGLAAIGASGGASIDRVAGPFAALLIAFFLTFYIGIPLLTLHWYAKFFRKAADSTRLGDLEFAFDATTWDWLKLFLGNLGLAIVTLGFGLTYWGYRNWAFMVRHARIYGSIDLSDMTQSKTHAPREAEGFADAFDIGAI